MKDSEGTIYRETGVHPTRTQELASHDRYWCGTDVHSAAVADVAVHWCWRWRWKPLSSAEALLLLPLSQKTVEEEMSSKDDVRKRGA